MTKKSSDRRFKKWADGFAEMFAIEREAFYKVWIALIERREKEVLSRASRQRRLASSKEIPGIFSVLANAKKLALAIGAIADQQGVPCTR